MNRPVVLCVDDKYLIPAKVFIYSLYATSSLPPGQIFIILHEDSLGESAINQLESQISEYGWSPIFVEASSIVPDILPLSASAHVSRAAFYRLFAGSLLGTEFDSALYLDVDMVAIASVEHLVSMRLEKPVAAVDHFTHQDPIRLWGASGGSYFQSGVLLIDLEWWRKNDIESEFRCILASKADLLRWWDQDVLNLVFKDQWQRLPWIYNAGLDCILQLGLDKINSDARIIHYDGSSKPWSKWSRRPCKSYWYQYYREFFDQAFAIAPTTRGFPAELLSLFKHGLSAVIQDLARAKS